MSQSDWIERKTERLDLFANLEGEKKTLHYFKHNDLYLFAFSFQMKDICISNQVPVKEGVTSDLYQARHRHRISLRSVSTGRSRICVWTPPIGFSNHLERQSNNIRMLNIWVINITIFIYQIILNLLCAAYF